MSKPLTAGLALALLAGLALPRADAASLDRRVLFARAYPSATPDADNIPIRHYYPLDVGRQWSYQDAVSGEAFTLKVTEHTSFRGRAVARVQDLSKPQYDLVTTSGALKLMFRQDATNGAMDWSADPVPFSMGDTVKVGDTYESTPTSYVNPVTGGHFRWVVRIRGFKDVTVPAGAFQGCLWVDVKTVDTKSGLEVAKFRMFLAPGVGLVRRGGRFVTTTFKQVLTATE